TLLEVSVMVSVSLRTPSVAPGLNRRLMVQVAPAASVAGIVVPHVPPVLVNPLPAVKAMLVIVKVPSPVFDSVTVCVAELVFRFTLPKLMLVGATLAMGAAPLPVTGTVRVGPLLETATRADSAAL